MHTWPGTPCRAASGHRAWITWVEALKRMLSWRPPRHQPPCLSPAAGPAHPTSQGGPPCAQPTQAAVKIHVRQADTTRYMTRL
jgi:hypothetical protein